MYLEKYPRLGVRPEVVDAVDEFVTWIQKGLDHSLKDWCGLTGKDLPDMETIIKLLPTRKTTYYIWDTDKRYPQNSMSEQVGYWRKANAIHNWFVNHVQSGVDDCQYHRSLTKQDLKDLSEACMAVLRDHTLAKKLLPVTSGFFFGSQMYDDWYYKDVENTFELCKHLIETFDFENYDLYYVSSW